jgi:hypothetical protein
MGETEENSTLRNNTEQNTRREEHGRDITEQHIRVTEQYIGEKEYNRI